MLREEHEFSFERIYEHVKHRPEECKLFEQALIDTFQEMDSAICHTRMGGIDETKVRKLIHSFMHPNHPSFVFTLNQDLFVERFYGDWEPSTPLKHLGMTPFPEHKSDAFKLGGEERPGPWRFLREGGDWVAAPRVPRGFYYVKLHGSYALQAHCGLEGMVVGGGKAETIKSVPLLNRLFQVFRAAIRAGNRRLLICGYGFGDAHVNAELLYAAQHHGLQLYLLDATSPDKLVGGIRQKEKSLEKYIVAFYTVNLEQLFATSGPHSTRKIWTEIRRRVCGTGPD